MQFKFWEEARHIRYASKHTDVGSRAPEKRTTIRVFSKEWEQFKALCHECHVTTCFVIRELVNEWMNARARHTESESLFYHRETQTLYVLNEYGKFKISL